MQIHWEKLTKLLWHWIARQVNGETLSWLTEKNHKITQETSDVVFLTTFSRIPRYTGKKNLELTVVDWQQIQELKIHWLPQKWTIDRVTRLWLLLSLYQNNPLKYLDLLTGLIDIADAEELLTVYQSLSLLPEPEKLLTLAQYGLRTNITDVFNAIALNNPYPAQWFDEATWNQMILKALFINSPLREIIDLDKRANANLARMLVDYSRERWAAKRNVNPEVWPLVYDFVDENSLLALKKETLLTNF